MIDLFNELDVVPLKADWTKRGPLILKSLESFGRKGVPLNVYYPPAGEGGSVSVDAKEFVGWYRTHCLQRSFDRGFRSDRSKNRWALFGSRIGRLCEHPWFRIPWRTDSEPNALRFPVLGLKIMSFVKQAGEEKSKISRHGVIFTCGVVLSFWVLVGVLFALRKALGEDLGWGFQLQEPVFVFVLAAFLLIFAMSLSGVLKSDFPLPA